MAREFELKLEIPAAAASKVMALPWLAQLNDEDAKRMTAVYFDTPKYTLRQRGISLRVRRIGNKHIQTVKATNGSGAFPMDRHEWEREVASDTPDLRYVGGTPLEAFSRRKLRRSLTPLFEVKVERNAYPVQSANSDIELAIDRGNISTTTSNMAFCEIELELKRGASAELARLARRLAEAAPVSLGLRSKADRGFDLRAELTPRVHHAEKLTLHSKARIDRSFQLIGWSCLRQVALNADAVKAGDNEGVHQMRVGLRRLRALTSIFKNLIDGPETDVIDAELEWLTNELGPARELHVFLETTLAPRGAAGAESEASQSVRETVLSHRDAALERARIALNGDRFRELVLRTALWLLAGDWSDNAEADGVPPDGKLRPFAAKLLTKWTQKLCRQLARVRTLDAAARHKLRIKAKKLRYATEFFAGLFPDRGRRKFTEILREVQDALGRVNDITVNRRLGQDLVHGWKEALVSNENVSPSNQYALGYAIGSEQHEIDGCLRATIAAGRKLANAKRFWD
ncbi:MAG TPA: CHAD domain-containing protein [Vitreimonas sp.]|jgi:inorganic triphosphatase YgiF|nr:CHAD domain-containing protein [Vitreimonas sp.]